VTFFDIHFARDLARYLAVITTISLLIVAELGVAVQLTSQSYGCEATPLNR
jgi:hypothetical protein